MFFNLRPGEVLLKSNTESLVVTKGPKHGSLTVTRVPRLKKCIYVFKNWKWKWGELSRFCCPSPQQEDAPEYELTMIVVNLRLNWDGFKRRSSD